MTTHFHDLSARTIDGRDQDLATYDGQVLLVVNTASQCGFTPQYQGLQSGFCEKNFGVTKPDKIAGDIEQAPVT